MNDISFRSLHADEFDDAYAIICEVTEWLLAKGIQQWERPFPMDRYRQRHDEGRNYGLFVGADLAVVGSLMPALPLYWGDYPAEKPMIWLSTLATALKFKGRKLGYRMLEQIDHHCRAQGIANIYVDCVYGFLPGYYEAAGYQWITRHLFHFPHDDFDAVLMKRPVSR
jgi:hypothetical protein